MTLSNHQLFLGSLSIWLSSCSVYRPTIPLLPAIRQAQEVEVKIAADAVNDNGPTFGAASIAYSPVRHLLLLAGGAGSFRSPQQGGYAYLQRHVEAGVGSYLPLRNDHVLSTQIGVATGISSNLRTEGVGFIGYHKELEETHVNFRRLQAQVGWQHYYTLQSGIAMNMEALYRFSRVFYKQYCVVSIDQNTTPLDESETEYFAIPAINRQEVMVQINLGLVKHPSWQIHLALGSSTSANRQDQPSIGYNQAIGKANLEWEGTWLGEIGLNFYPHNFRKGSKWPK